LIESSDDVVEIRQNADGSKTAVIAAAPTVFGGKERKKADSSLKRNGGRFETGDLRQPVSIAGRSAADDLVTSASRVDGCVSASRTRPTSMTDRGSHRTATLVEPGRVTVRPRMPTMWWRNVPTAERTVSSSLTPSGPERISSTTSSPMA
jgi:hypothetical protein